MGPLPRDKSIVHSYKIARFLLVQYTKTGKNISSDDKIHKVNRRKIDQHLLLKEPPKFTQNKIPGLKIYVAIWQPCIHKVDRKIALKMIGCFRKWKSKNSCSPQPKKIWAKLFISHFSYVNHTKNA
jgi:hypothetical protein